MTSKLVREARDSECDLKLPDLSICALGPWTSPLVGTSLMLGWHTHFLSLTLKVTLGGGAKKLVRRRSMLAPPLTLFQNPGMIRSNRGTMGPEAEGLWDGPCPRVRAWATAWQTTRAGSKDDRLLRCRGGGADRQVCARGSDEHCWG